MEVAATLTSQTTVSCVDPESFVRGGPPLNFDLVDERRRENLNNTKIGPPLAHQCNVI